jgi:tRNA A-37 threonylcarbamoyl transferase component Bud32
VTLADKIRSFLAGTSVSDSETIEAAGKQLAIVHTHGCSFGNLKPKNVIVSKDSDNHHQQRQQQQQQPPQLYFTDLEQFTINGGDQIWDIAQFVCWGLKYTSAIEPAARLVSKFLDGYMQSPESTATVQKLARSRRHIESFYPVLAPQVARVIKDEVKKRANSS